MIRHLPIMNSRKIRDLNLTLTILVNVKLKTRIKKSTLLDVLSTYFMDTSPLFEKACDVRLNISIVNIDLKDTLDVANIYVIILIYYQYCLCFLMSNLLME